MDLFSTRALKCSNRQQEGPVPDPLVDLFIIASNHKDLDRLIESLPGAVGEVTFFDLEGCLLANVLWCSS